MKQAPGKQQHKKIKKDKEKGAVKQSFTFSHTGHILTYSLIASSFYSHYTRSDVTSVSINIYIHILRTYTPNTTKIPIYPPPQGVTYTPFYITPQQPNPSQPTHTDSSTHKHSQPTNLALCTTCKHLFFPHQRTRTTTHAKHKENPTLRPLAQPPARQVVFHLPLRNFLSLRFTHSPTHPLARLLIDYLPSIYHLLYINVYLSIPINQIINQNLQTSEPVNQELRYIKIDI